MFILRLALLTCVFYLVMAVLAPAAEIAASHLMGGLSISSAVLAIFFALAWLISFSLAWRVLTWRMGRSGWILP
jgi:hypothetical protein